MAKLMKAIMAEEDGAVMVEYALKAALIAAMMIVVVGMFASAMSAKFSGITNLMQ